MAKKTEKTNETALSALEIQSEVTKATQAGTFYAGVWDKTYIFGKSKHALIDQLRAMPGCVLNAATNEYDFPVTTEEELERVQRTFANTRLTFQAADVARAFGWNMDEPDSLRAALALLAKASPDAKGDGPKRTIEEERRYTNTRKAWSDLLFSANILSPDPKAIAKRKVAAELEAAKQAATKRLESEEAKVKAEKAKADELAKQAAQAKADLEAATTKAAKAKAEKTATELAAKQAEQEKIVAEQSEALNKATVQAVNLGVEVTKGPGAPKGNENAKRQEQKEDAKIVALFPRGKQDAAVIVKAIEKIGFDIADCQAANDKTIDGELGAILRRLYEAAMAAKREALEWAAKQDRAKSGEHNEKMKTA